MNPSSIHTAELICTGDELLNGATLNTHSRTLGEALKRRGVVLVREASLRDDQAAIAAAIRAALARVDVVFVTGGLGPTRDDIAREAVAEALGCGLEIDKVFERAIRMRYKAAGRTWTPDRARQALRVEGGTLLKNPVGSAPAHRIAVTVAADDVAADDAATDEAAAEKLLFVLPGPPREFVACLQSEILPEIAERSAGRRVERSCMVAGMGESEVERILAGHEFPAGVELGFRANPMGLELRLVASEEGPELDTASAQLRDLLGAHIYSDQRMYLPEFVTRTLLERGLTACTAESCTAGWLGKYLTDLPGSSSAFVGGVIAYSNEIKERLLDVPRDLLIAHGAVSEPVAKAMAAGARARLGADYALSITGIAGPGGGTETKPVGLVFVGLAGPEGARAFEHRLSGDREQIRMFAAMRALNALRVTLG